jgi:hypothetical protein
VQQQAWDCHHFCGGAEGVMVFFFSSEMMGHEEGQRDFTGLYICTSSSFGRENKWTLLYDCPPCYLLMGS